jgi:hypothetical protein
LCIPSKFPKSGQIDKPFQHTFSNINFTVPYNAPIRTNSNKIARSYRCKITVNGSPAVCLDGSTNRSREFGVEFTIPHTHTHIHINAHNNTTLQGHALVITTRVQANAHNTMVFTLPLHSLLLVSSSLRFSEIESLCSYQLSKLFAQAII